MQTQLPRSALLSGLSVVIVVGAMGAILVRFAAPLVNPDTFFHLRLGHEFLGGWSASHPGSVTPYATADWVPTQWLSQLAYAAFEDWFGLAGVAWLTGTVCLLFVLVVALGARQHSSVLPASFITAVVIYSVAPTLSSRPQVISYALTTVVVLGWLRFQDRGRVPWWIVPVTWVWVLLHGMWVVGVSVSLAAVVGHWLDRREGATPAARRAGRAAALVPVLSLVVAALTPVGPRLLAGVIRVGSITEHFKEWGPPDFTEVQTLVAALLFALTVVAGLRAGTWSWMDIALVVTAGTWLLYADRTTPVAAAILVPFLARALGSLLPDRAGFAWEVPGLVAAGALMSLLLAFLVHQSAGEAPRTGSPVSARVAELPAGTPLLNEWAEGGIDMWLYPHLEIVQHGYGDMFTTEELERNVRLNDLEPEWDEDLRDLGVRHALLYPDSRLTYALTEQEDWEVVAQDDALVLLRAPADWPDRAPATP